MFVLASLVAYGLTQTVFGGLVRRALHRPSRAINPLIVLAVFGLLVGLSGDARAGQGNRVLAVLRRQGGRLPVPVAADEHRDAARGRDQRHRGRRVGRARRLPQRAVDVHPARRRSAGVARARLVAARGARALRAVGP